MDSSRAFRSTEGRSWPLRVVSREGTKRSNSVEARREHRYRFTREERVRAKQENRFPRENRFAGVSHRYTDRAEEVDPTIFGENRRPEIPIKRSLVVGTPWERNVLPRRNDVSVIDGYQVTAKIALSLSLSWLYSLPPGCLGPRVT